MLNSRHTETQRWAVFTIAAFFATFFVLQMSYQHCRGTFIEHLVIDEITVSPSGKLISWITPQENVTAHGHTLVSKHVRLSILNGCEGTEAILMLGAAILVFPSGRRSKMLGIIKGTLLIYSMNLARIVALYYCLRFDHPLFEMLHSYIAPILVIAVAGLYFFYWVSGAKTAQSA